MGRGGGAGVVARKGGWGEVKGAKDQEKKAKINNVYKNTVISVPWRPFLLLLVLLLLLLLFVFVLIVVVVEKGCAQSSHCATNKETKNQTNFTLVCACVRVCVLPVLYFWP